MNSAGSVLVVEDQEQITMVINHILQRAGYWYQNAENGAVALEKLNNGLRPDIILLDIVMPVVMLTSLNDTVDVMNAVKRGAADYCTKPIEVDDLLETMDRVFARQQVLGNHKV